MTTKRERRYMEATGLHIEVWKEGHGHFPYRWYIVCDNSKRQDDGQPYGYLLPWDASGSATTRWGAKIVARYNLWKIATERSDRPTERIY